MKLKTKLQVRKEISKLPELYDYQHAMVTPRSDEAMVKYLLDSIAWLDSFDDDVSV